MNGKTILITDNGTSDILCIIKTFNEGETRAAINSVIDRLPGAWSLEDILEELTGKPYVTDIMTDFSTISI